MTTSEIKIKIDKDSNHVPEKITWTAGDANITDSPSDAMILAMWDEESQSTLRMDLWTKDMKVDAMKFFVHETIFTLADSFEKATGENAMAETMRDFCAFFAEKMKLDQTS